MKNEDLQVQGHPAKSLSIRAFQDALRMTDWEYAAYDAYGQENCDRDKIEDLRDLFGMDFGDAFYAWKDWLNLSADINRINAEIRDLTAKVAEKHRERDALRAKIPD